MEGQASSALGTMTSGRAEVDTARPFRSVKEAVAVFGERILAGDSHSQKTMSSATSKPMYSAPPPPKPIYAVSTPKPLYSAPSSPPSYSSSSSHFNQDGEDELIILSSLKKLEEELEETKRELAMLKKRESETQVAVASLNAELHKNMSKLAEMEAVGAAMAAKGGRVIEEQSSKVGSDRWGDERTGFEYLPSLAEALSLGEISMDRNFGRRTNTKALKKKPIMPLIGDIFSKKKGSNEFNSSMYAPSYYSELS